ncbi:LamG domain-containing protein [Haloprofundus sp. MHR1]|uniref:LamG domain-containing protein n=1 Tax=Haloprofundus sp. MHR1 TaxID=2572921 RepID=UPI00143D45B0|nr:LamG domain-containing protein [Haloprofundus sp. MHR1]
MAEEDEPVNDRGEPITEKQPRFSTVQTLEINPSPLPNGKIAASTYRRLNEGAPQTQNERALRVADDGGVKPQFRPSTDGDLTIDMFWRHAQGSGLGYLFNDQDSASYGFRAFTNGIAGRGLYFRNVFGGGDIAVSGDFQDGQWYNIRVVLDASENTYTVYINGQQVGQSFYDGNGFTARDQFRVMGRRRGTATLSDYDRYVITRAVATPADATLPTGDLIQYPLDEESGRTVTNTPGEQSPPDTNPRSFQEVADQKRRLAAQVSTVSPSIDERSRVGETLSGIEQSLEDELIDEALATDIVERHKAGENVTENLLGIISPQTLDSPQNPDNLIGAPTDSPAADGRYDVAGRSVSSAISLTVIILTGVRALKSIAQSIDRVGEATVFAEDAIQLTTGLMVGSFDEIVSPVSNAIDEALAVVLESIFDNEIEDGETLGAILGDFIDDKRDTLGNGLVATFEKVIPGRAIDDNLVEFDEALGGTEPETADIGGTTTDAQEAAQRGIEAMNEEVIEKRKAFELFDLIGLVTSFLGLAGTIMLYTGFLAPVGAALTLVSLLFGLTAATLSTIGGLSVLFTTVDIHNATLDDVVTGGGV